MPPDQAERIVPLEIDIRPQVEVLRMFAAMKYTPWFALGEFIDNAITSAGQHAAALQRGDPGYHLRVDVRFDEGAGVIEICDNAAGISAGDLPRALRTASPPKDKRFLSIYGVGMKAAGLWWADTLTIETTALGEPVRRSVTIDVRQLDQPRSESVHVTERAARPAEHGTTLRLSNLTKKLPEKRTLGKCRDYLASMYRNFLREGTTIVVKGQPLAFDNPRFLKAPFWPSTSGPAAGAEETEWFKHLDVTLSSGQRVAGWVGLLQKGSTAGAGLLLTFHGKAVVGVGAGTVQGDEVYRPARLFGGSNSYRRQRLVGEFDVSAFGKSITSDSVGWSPEQEDEFLELVRAELLARPSSFIEMAENYRSRADRDARRSTQDATDDTVSAVEETLVSQGGLLVGPNAPSHESSIPAPVTASRSTRTTIAVAGRSEPVTVRLSVEQAGTADWLSLRTEDGALVVRVNEDHPFMLSFAQLPRQELEPVLRLAVGLGVAEFVDPDHVRTRLNMLLRGPLSERHESGRHDGPE